MIDANSLKQLGWSDELIAAASAVARNIDEPVVVATSEIEIIEDRFIVSTGIDVSRTPPVATNTIYI